MKTHTGTVVAVAALLLCGLLYCVSLQQLSLAEGYYGGLTQVRMNGLPVTARQMENMAEQRRAEAEKEASGNLAGGNTSGGDSSTETNGRAGSGGSAAETDSLDGGTEAGGRIVESGEALESAPGAASLRYTAWTEKKGIQLENKELGRKTKVDVIYYCGDESPRFHLALYNGCSVSEKTAFALWGTAEEDNVLGNSVLIGTKEFVVEQIIRSGTPAEKWTGDAVIARWIEKEISSGAGQNREEGSPENEGETMLFDVLDISHKVGGKAPVSEALMSANLISDVEISYDELIAAVSALRKLPFWGIVIYASARLILTGRKQSGRTFAILLTAAGFTLPIAAALVLGAPFVIPQSLIPTRWSDFEFWSTTAEAAGNTLNILTTMQLYGPDVWLRSIFISTVLLCVLQTALLLLCSCLLIHRLQGNGRD